jgi:hypothetical protein
MHIFRNSSVHAHDFLIDQSDERDMVEAIAESLKQCNFISSLDFIEKAINSSDGLTFVISSQNYNLLRKSDFECE